VKGATQNHDGRLAKRSTDGFGRRTLRIVGLFKGIHIITVMNRSELVIPTDMFGG
jgi:hypothetical protein